MIFHTLSTQIQKPSVILRLEQIQKERDNAKAEKARLEALEAARILAEQQAAQVAIQAPRPVIAPIVVSGSHTDWLAAAGIPQSDWSCADAIITRESGWRVNAYNPSGAFGIPQSLPGSKMASAGADWATNPVTQLRWMHGYVQSYGGFCGAWSFWQTHHYY